MKFDVAAASAVSAGAGARAGVDAISGAACGTGAGPGVRTDAIAGAGESAAINENISFHSSYPFSLFSMHNISQVVFLGLYASENVPMFAHSLSLQLFMFF